MAGQSIRDRYWTLLRDYVARPEEEYLAAAAELGRELVLADVPTEEIAEIHEEALHCLARDFPDMTLLDAAQLVSQPLMELLMAYGLAFRERLEAHRRVEEERLKAQKLESVGILAGGIAHDFNNILTAILGNISLARMYANPEDEIYDAMSKAERASLRAKDLAQQLLTFSKGSAPIKKTISIYRLIRESADFALRGSKVRCQYAMSNDLWPVDVDEGQMSQVIRNLIINADQAMPEGGTITLRAENVTVGAKQLPPLKEGKYAKISVEDRGIGIPEEHLPRIFDPYFTTKQKGSGLGLAVAYSIVKKHDGWITVDSELSVGTTFHIYLPASQKEIPGKRDDGEEAIIMGGGRVLVMDDKDFIREVASRMLSHIGYEVETANDGAEAIALYQRAKESGQSFDVVIMDLTVRGGVGGKEAIRKLLKIDPNAKAIVSSGYATDPIMADFRRYGFRGAIPKPYRLRDLAQTVYNVMMETGNEFIGGR